jgi:PAS domain S-box-containing protein
MHALRDLSIRRKLTLIIMSISTVALLLACVALAAYDIVTFRSSKAERLFVRAEIIANTSTAALAFDDARAADETLRALRADTHIVCACIFAKDGQRFATYLRPGASADRLPATPEADGYRFGSDRLEMFHRILLDGKVVGTLYLQADLDEISARLERFGAAVALVLLMSGLLALLLTARLQRLIAGPIDHLVGVAKVVSAEKNYAVRAAKHGNDEVGDLIDAFNEMLSQIQARDAALSKAHDELEQRVERRTQELQQEITRRAEAEALLRDSENTLRTMAAAAHDAVIMIDADGKIAFWNDAAVTMFGYTADEVVGRELHPLLVPQRYLEAYRAGFATFRQTGTGAAVGTTTELVGLRKGGHEFPVEVAISAVNLKGQWHAVGITRDITERKRAEAELRAAKDAAEGATRAKSAFLANMSHEIRTPMNAIIGMTGLLLDTRLTPEQAEFADTIRTSGDALLTIINDILDFSKIESGRLELESQPFDLPGCIEESLDLLAADAAGKQIELAYLMEDGTPPAIVGDVTRLRQVLVNLISNAVKFTETGEVVVEVGARFRSPDDCQLHFTVRDTGIGIPSERQNRLFESFSQVDASTTRRYGGTGLGLAISKRLSELMGGTMWVESEVGRGSTFHFTITTQAASVSTLPALPPARPVPDGKRLLIVDDNATNRRILMLQAEKWGLLPRAAASGREALDWIDRGESFDVAILDMRMPVMDGEELAQAIRQRRAPHELPLIMLTSIGRREDDLKKGLFAAYLTKPIKPSLLYNVLAGVFGTNGPEAKTPTTQRLIDREMALRKPLQILLAEDNVVNQRVALRILERLGYRADLAANGVEVLEALRRRRYDVVLMDVQMPEMDGLEATRHIRQDWPAHDQPWVVAVTASAMREDRDECLRIGMDDYISKPVQVIGLQAALERVARHAPEDPTPSPPGAAPQ